MRLNIRLKEHMRAVIPVAGFGTRLKPYTYAVPKVLLNVGGQPILGHILRSLLADNITKATFIIGHLGEQIIEYVKAEFPEIDSDFVDQYEMEGLGHAIFKAIPTFDEEEIFIILGDTIFDVDLKGVFKKGVTSLGVKEVADPRRFGVAVCENGRITRLVEKPKIPMSNLALVGMYYIAHADMLIKSLNELVERDIRTGGELQLTDALQIMIDKGEEIRTFPVEGWYDCGKPETLLSTNRFLLSKNSPVRKLENVVINNPVYIAENATVTNSVIGPYTTVDEGCHISDSIIRNSILGKDSEVEKSILENSIIGNHTIIRGSYKKCNAGDSSEIDLY